MLPLARSRTVRRLAIASIVVEAGRAFLRGERRVAAVLVGAAILARRVPALGVAAPLILRLYRRSAGTN